MASFRARVPAVFVLAVLASSCAAGGEDLDPGTPIKKDTGVKDGTAADSVAEDTDPGKDTGAAGDGAVDSGSGDTATGDTGLSDTGLADTGTPDTGTPDTGTPDTGTPDTGTPDTGTLDTGTPDTGTPDTGVTAKFTFPNATDTASVVWEPYFWNNGDYYQGSRTTTLTSATSFSSSIAITNSLTCGSLTLNVLLNSKIIGSLTITPTSGAAIPANFTFAAVAGTTYTLRYQATKTVESGCGAVQFTKGVSTVTLK